jgi:hypothetical protein
LRKNNNAKTYGLDAYTFTREKETDRKEGKKEREKADKR